MAKTPASSASAPATPKKRRFNTIRQMGEVFTFVRQNDPAAVWWMLLAGVIGAGIWAALGVFLMHPKGIIGWVIVAIGAILMFITPAMVVLGRRAQSVQYKMLAGTPGAPVAIFNQIRRGWYTTQAPVAINRNQELVTRTVGRAGVVLVLEGNSPAANQLLATEHKRTARIVGEVPVHDIVLGDGPNQVPLRKLTRYVQKLPKVLTQSEARDINKRLQAIAQQPVGLPKGPLPKGARLPKMPKG